VKVKWTKKRKSIYFISQKMNLKILISILFASTGFLFSSNLTSFSYLTIFTLFFVNITLFVKITFPFKKRDTVFGIEVTKLDIKFLNEYIDSIKKLHCSYYMWRLQDHKEPALKKVYFFGHFRIWFICFYIMFAVLTISNKILLLEIGPIYDIAFIIITVIVFVLLYIFVYEPQKTEEITETYNKPF